MFRMVNDYIRMMLLIVLSTVFIIGVSAQNQPTQPDRLDPALRALATEPQQVEVIEQREFQFLWFTFTVPIRVTRDVPQDDYVIIDATALPGQAPLLLDELEALGMINGAYYSNIVSGQLPTSAILALDDLQHLHYARASQPFIDPPINPVGGASTDGSDMP